MRYRSLMRQVWFVATLPLACAPAAAAVEPLPNVKASEVRAVKASAASNPFVPIGAIDLVNDGDVLRRQRIGVDLRALSSVSKPGARFPLPLLNLEPMTLIVSAVETRPAGRTLHGTIEGDAFGTFTLTLEGENVSAGFWTRAGVFGLAPIDQRDQQGRTLCDLIERDPSSVVRCAMGAERPAGAAPADPGVMGDSSPRLHSHEHADHPMSPRGAPERGGACGCADDQSRVDVLVVYTTLAKNAAGGQAALQTRVQNAFDTANGAFTNSGLNSGAVNRLQIHMAGFVETAYDEQAPAWLDHLVRITDVDDGILDDIHALRDSYLADTVCFVINDERFTGGAGWWAIWDQGQAFTCLNWRGVGAGSLLLAHELGHNFGCAHDYENDPTAPFFFGRGHYFTHQGTSYGTIMSYPGDVHIQYYSNPTLTPAPANQPVGAPLSSPRAAWNARVIEQSRWTLASYRDSGRMIDCNANGVNDAADISSGFSLDANANCRPDECETRVYVDASAPGEGDGAGWSSAVKQLANATSFASLKCNNVSQIWVADGVYKPDFFGASQTGDRFADFTLRSGVSLSGGFQGQSRPGGGETSIAQRTAGAFPSILSGDIGVAGNANDNSYSVATAYQAHGGVRLDGFTLEDGYSDWSGAGLYLEDANATVVDCHFRSNHSGSGGGALLARSSAASFTRCDFDDNSAEFGGGALGVYESGVVAIDQCSFTFNSGAWGGAVATSGGNGVSTTIRSSIFRKNSAVVYNGGAVDCDDAALTLANSIFSGNASTQDAGAVWTANNSVVNVSNCTFSGNNAGTYTGGLVAYFDTANIANTIFWGNTGSYETEQDRQLVYFGATGAIRYSRVGGWSGSLGGPGNSGADPLFTNAGDRDFTLRAGSSCIDAGDTGSLLAGLTLDAIGSPRRADDPATTDTGVGPAPVVDIGATEYQPGSVCRADFNHDASVNSQDFFDFLAAFFSAHPSADFNVDSVINSQDFFDFLAAFFAGC